MADRSHTCWKCRSYDREALRCRLGKSNPPRKHEAVMLVEFLGPQTLCIYSPFRDALVYRRCWPEKRFLWSERNVSAGGQVYEVEPMDE